MCTYVGLHCSIVPRKVSFDGGVRFLGQGFVVAYGTRKRDINMCLKQYFRFLR